MIYKGGFGVAGPSPPAGTPTPAIVEEAGKSRSKNYKAFFGNFTAVKLPR